MQLGRLSKVALCLLWFGPTLLPPVSSRSRKQCGQVDCGGVPLGSSCFSDPSHFQLKVTFHLKHKQFPLEALMDSGAAENFIDLNLASQLHISLTPINNLFLSLGRRTPSPTLSHSVPDPTSSHVHRGPLGVDPVSRGLCCILSSHPELTFLIGDPDSPLVSGRSSAV